MANRAKQESIDQPEIMQGEPAKYHGDKLLHPAGSGSSRVRMHDGTGEGSSGRGNDHSKSAKRQGKRPRR